MKITVNQDDSFDLEHVYLPITLVTDDKEEMSIVMRDSGFEFKYQGDWYSAKNGKVEIMKKTMEMLDGDLKHNESVVNKIPSGDDFFMMSKNNNTKKLMFGATHKGLSLYKKYEDQDTNIDWSPEEVLLVASLFNKTWLIERPVIMFGNEFLTVSENGENNRPWAEEEITKIANIFNNYEKNIR